MYKTIIILLIFLFYGITLKPQIKPDPKEVDVKTYSLYTAGKWGELTEECEKAISKGVDFFYLRLRAGIAYYNLKNYISAIPHFEKAMKYSPADLLTIEYLYYSYLFSGRESDVLSLVSVMPSTLKKKFDVDEKFIYGVYMEGGYTVNGDFSDQKKKNKLSPSGVSGEQVVYNNGTYIDFGLMHQLGKNVKVFHSYNNISVSGTKQIFTQSDGQKDFDIKIRQNEYYLNVNFRLAGGFDLTTAFHYLNVRYDDYDVDYGSSQTKYTLTKNTSDDFAALLSLSVYTGHFKLALKNSLANLNRATQVQNTAQIIFFPLGNLNLYTVTDATVLSGRNWGDSKFISNGILDQKIGWKVFDNLWMEAGYTFGYIYNYLESDAFIVFNNVDRISNRASLNFIVPVSRHIGLSLRYQYYNQEVTNLNNNSLGNSSINLTNNNIHKIIGGLKWTF